MTLKTPLITDHDDYAALCRRASEVFLLKGGGLPEQVFEKGFTKFCFVEFDVLTFPDFWNVLAACAKNYGDTDISVIVHEPDPEAYYFANFRRYGALRFDPNTSEGDYKNAWLLEPEGSPVDAFEYVASVVSWCGSSREWGFWGERGLGVGIGATRKARIPWPIIEGVTWFDVDDAIRNLIALNFENQTVPADFAAKLRSNFATGEIVAS
jgi:hypothetical protein